MRPRIMLVNEGLFGEVAATLKDLLRAAYADFRSWCRGAKISCSQPMFTPGLVPWMRAVSKCLRKTF